MSIDVCNLRKEKCKYPYDVRVDRASILGNPFYMASESQRMEVCAKYEVYFKDSYRNNKAFHAAVWDLVRIYKEYGKLRLFCWCAPKQCHADYIKVVVEYLSE